MEQKIASKRRSQVSREEGQQVAVVFRPMNALQRMTENDVKITIGDMKPLGNKDVWSVKDFCHLRQSVKPGESPLQFRAVGFEYEQLNGLATRVDE